MFGWNLGDVPFVDEYAYITQSYYADLLFEGRTNDPAWLDFPAYDLVPLPKYLIGLALRAAGERRPGPEAARAWYGDTSNRYGPPRVLTVSRAPSIVLGAIGCVALAVIGGLAFDLRVGLVAAVLLMLNPLYALHAHRAMSEAPCEAFLMVALALALAAWKRALAPETGWRLMLWLPATGLATALAVLAKFNGLLTLMTLGVWVGLAWAIPRGGPWGWVRFASGALVAVVAAGAGFIALNPYMTARPAPPLRPEAQQIAEMGAWARFRLLIDHRRTMSASQQQAFAHNALTTPLERAKVVAAQGFGRFGPLGPRKSDSTRRYDFEQDWGAFGWLPLCLAGLGYALAIGLVQFHRREPPAAWAAAAWAVVSLVVVASYLPMAWDRYQLPIQAPFTLLAASALVAIGDALGRLVGLKSKVGPT
ncbi:phospholipid carrier-dependent glycosyltransferase [Paludisphaera mucosa]|uniref:Phospholipid carrier-dependent glycosyltransferase n=1 Tax=Paludisphaera mucosa TaxID=3030827 RepID=A0ABT6FFE6_9BACT|nr:phospholipid carrier-dependent glycosyltransferase [Paludisphaera mucosa]